jgi:hypothetical protein
MRSTLAPVLLSLSLAAVACGSVDQPPLGGPFGGSTDPTDPNGGQNGVDPNSNNNNNNTTDAGSNNNTSQDAGSTSTPKDSGTTSTPKDSGTQVQDSGSQTQTAPTWTSIYNNYMKSGTKGKCSSCHSQSSSASGLYSWLQGRGYISGKSSALVDSNQSCLSWYGGNMPPSGPSSYGNAVSDMNAWAAAGAQNN